MAENGKKEFAFIYKNKVILRGVATDRNFKNIVYGFYRDLYHPFKMIDRLEELYKTSLLRKAFIRIFRVQGGILPNASSKYRYNRINQSEQTIYIGL